MDRKNIIPRKASIGVCFLAFCIAACDATTDEEADPTEDQAGPPEKETAIVESAPVETYQKPETVAERRELRLQLAERGAKKVEELDKQHASEADPVSGEVPEEIIDKIMQDLMTNTAADRADIEVLHAESLTWNDGSLGCGKPGQAYTQALVPGYRVILGHAGQNFDYRATEHGLFMLCEQPTLAAPGAGIEPPVQ